MKGFILGIALCLVACAETRDSAELVNGYKLWAMNGAEIYVARPNNELIIGPTIETLGLTGNVIVAYSGLEKRVVNGFENTIGYNIVDTKTGELLTRLSEQDMHAQLRRLNVTIPKMQSASVFLQGRR